MAFEIKRNDRRPRFRVQLTSNGDPVDLTDASAARFILKTGTTTKVNKQPMTFVDRATGVVEYAWDATDTDTSGDYNAEVEIDWGGAPAELQTFPSTGYFTVKINDDLV
jgi:BppU N-terminal domain